MSHTPHGRGPVPKVLIVDDDAIDREALLRAFDNAGSEVETHEAEDGVQALEILRGGDDRAPLAPPYVVVLDLNMPRMNGFEFLAELRRDRRLRRVAVFVLTTSAAPGDIERAHELGIAGYIVKARAMRSLASLVTLLETYPRVVTPVP